MTALNPTRELELPRTDVPHFAQVPRSGLLWSRAMVGVWILLAIFCFDRVALLLANLWLLERLDLASVFWTNFWTGAALFASGFVGFGVAVAAPAFLQRLRGSGRLVALHLALIAGLAGGYFLSLRYADFLTLFGGLPFGREDPVFGNDLGFYVLSLPGLWVTWTATASAAFAFLVSSIACAPRTLQTGGASRVSVGIARLATRYTRTALILLGVVLASGVWLSRYNVLFRHNKHSAIYNGAQYVDVVGLFSTLMDYRFSALVVLVGAFAVERLLASLAISSSPGSDRGRPAARWATVLLAVVVLDFLFKGAVSVRNTILVRPNEPVIQIPYIRAHIDATRDGFGLDAIEEVSFAPKGPDDPLPDVEALLASPTLRNAPLWPGFATYLARVVKEEHAERILQTGGDAMIYGPTLEVFQQRKLRPYYEFLNVDAVRYQIDGEPQMLVSAVRELPVLDWLDYWGQRLMMFTHGYGLAAAMVGETGTEGGPNYITDSNELMEKSPLVGGATQRIYYGEGSGTMAFSNMRQVKEFDFPTAEGRAEMMLATDIESGIPVDSLLKRIVFGWRGGQFFEVVFSSLIGPDTRAHYNRQPVERLKRAAPFLYWDTNAYAVVADGKIVWLVNGLTSTDQFPYSKRRWLGDRATARTTFPEPFRRTNYIRDAVKATVDSDTGAVRLYRISDEPIVRTWASIYPDLFIDGKEMPQSIREHLQYPVPLYEIQFDDVYDIYHMKDLMTFFNVEDAWDDGYEVLGPILDQGEAITFTMEPTQWIAVADGDPLPKSDGPVQFALSMPYTPEFAKNLRAIPIAYQSGADYGRLISVQIPKGSFAFGPEQADAAID
ncbi:MAG: UPF0182 family protein, partial [Dehalococcoidia bacterium]